ncbi:polyketide-type polyunsaturated fatty acid synthase PfaA [Desulfobotulus alkaliphilus]|uniref:Polyketide-type polyunsaturated fatty acid synthase PfaA n=1 Tax=Desulfobotulus alkaliphilus TaxID=622671 RepID=A0A562R7N6_9BACT|nr:type I polyketide synthase [Desulfobotulus alkaliphilus]TWI65061.1 polyketide-type polyunsaturated fatty acid synthase PfaA [Desulfobotulus alkaliphilus]
MTPSSISKPCDLAVIGMACLFPQSPDRLAFWRLIFRNLDAIGEVPQSHWSKEAYFAPSPGAPDKTYCTRGGYLAPYPFDPSAFGIPPNLLEVTDTSQLLGLVTARCALDDAGYPQQREYDNSRTSVILGATGTQELVVPLASRLSHPLWKEALEAEGIPEDVQNAIMERMAAGHTAWQENAFPGLLGNVIAGRIANRLNLGGSNCVVDAACGSSLAAVHMAVLELQTGKADMVITGGVDTLNDIFMHMCFAQTGVLSHSGDARPFSEKADGTVLGEGVGMAVLKRLKDAEKDGDRIYAVIKGMGTASDGRSQSIYAPGAEGQMRALQKACEGAGFPPSSVDLVEAHGTGTRVGDAVEFKALQAVYGQDRDTRPCILSSVKANIGHTKAAAGMAGFIKIVLCLYNKVLPPALKHLPPDPELDLASSGFCMLSQAMPWTTEKNRPRRAAVSAFGFGGADYHAVLEEYGRKRKEGVWDFDTDIFSVSGPDTDTLLHKLADLEKTDRKEPRMLQEVCSRSRLAFSSTDRFRLLLLLEKDSDMADIIKEAKAILGEEKEGQHGPVFFGKGETPGKLAFLFPGQGSQYPGMGKDLACIFPEMLETLELGDATLAEYAAPHRRDQLLSRFIHPFTGEGKEEEEILRSTDLAQPAIGCVSLGMARILERFGIRPHAACGHSYGELPALCCAAVFQETECMQLSVLRGRYMAGDPDDPRDRGGMMAVRGDGETLKRLIEKENLNVVLANENSPSQCVLSGGKEALDHAAKVLKSHKIRGIRLPVAAAFHSPLVEDAAKPFAEALQGITPNAPSMEVMANSTGLAYERDGNAIRQTLSSQLLSPVRFISNIRYLYDEGVRTFVETGPKNVLTGLASAILEQEAVHCFAMDASAGKNPGDRDLLILLCHLAALGYGVDWSGIPEPPPNPERRMTIWLSGANIKPEPGKKAAEKKRPLQTADRKPLPAGNLAPDQNRGAKALPGPAAQSPAKTNQSSAAVAPADTRQRSDAAPAVHPFTHPPAAALQKRGKPMDSRVLMEGFQTLKALQEQTTRAHEQFLTLQSEAGRTLERLIHSMGSGEENLLPASPAGSFSQTKGAAPVGGLSTPARDLSPDPRPAVPASRPPEEPATKAPDAMEKSLQGEASALPLLKAIVARHTGYPEDMIQADMDLEADLGIDSIKRVEILSELEGHFPAMAAFAPEVLAEARSLQAFANLLADSPAAIPGPAETRKTASPAKLSPIPAITELVSRHTGYPEDMIQADMDLEADLGIDSIKRVEILSELEGLYPSLATLAQEVLATARSIAAIAALVAPEAGADTALLPPSIQDGKGSPRADAAAEVRSIIARHTGYPEEMIQENMDLEADLGIDSIKRVEILSELEGLYPSLATVPADLLQECRSVQAIASLLSDPASEKGRPSPITVMEEKAPFSEISSHPEEAPPFAEELCLIRQTIRWEGFDPEGESLPASLMLLQDFCDETDLAAVAEKLSLTRLHTGSAEEALASFQPGLIVPWAAHNDEKALEKLFTFLGAWGKKALASSQACSLCIFTRSDGSLGEKDPFRASPETQSLAGLMRTLQKEWPHMALRLTDLSAEAGATESMLKKLLFGHGPLILGCDASGHIHTPLLKENAATETGPAFTSPARDDLMLITGGAYGVTAACVEALARFWPCRMIFTGRSPEPGPEPLWLSGIQKKEDIRKALLRHHFAGKTPTPKELDGEYNRIKNGRAIRDTLKKMKSLGCDARYLSMDLEKPDAIEGLFQKLKEENTLPSLWVHGAGVLADRAMVDKNSDDFRKVFSVKARFAKHMAEAMKDMPMKAMIFFSSVASLEGNPGQADYAVANGVLNAIARRESLKRNHCRVVSICWGPWEGGMVTPALARHFQRQGVDLIPLDRGSEAFAREILSGHVPEVLLAADRKAEKKTLKPETRASNAPETLRILSLKKSPELKDHSIAGKAVVPFASLACEILRQEGGQPARSAADSEYRILEDLRLLKGCVLEEDSLLPLEVQKKGHERTLVSLEKKPAIPRMRGTIRSGRITPLPLPGLIHARPYPRDCRTVYDKILFHGQTYQVLQKIEAMGDNGMKASLAPEALQAHPDPLSLILDSAMQLACLFSFESRGSVCLPTHVKSLHLPLSFTTSTFAPDRVKEVIYIAESSSSNQLVGSIFFLDKNDTPCMEIRGLTMTGSETMAENFKTGGITLSPCLSGDGASLSEGDFSLPDRQRSAG